MSPTVQAKLEALYEEAKDSADHDDLVAAGTAKLLISAALDGSIWALSAYLMAWGQAAVKRLRDELGAVEAP